MEDELAKKHVVGSEGKVAGTGCQAFACGLEVQVSQINHCKCGLNANGPAIKLVGIAE